MLTDEEIKKALWNLAGPVESSNNKSLIEFAHAIERAVLAKAMPIPKQEPVENPNEWIIEKLSYHKYERDDLNIEGCLNYLESEWKEIRGRTKRQLVMQILSLLAHPQPAQAAAIPSPSKCCAHWRNDAIENAAAIADRHLAEFVAQDIRAMLSASPKPE